jgi:alpha-mannosidase
LNDPLRAVDVEAHAGGAPPAPPFIVEGPGVRLGAIKRAEDGDALVLRLIETDGKASSAMLRFAAPATVAEANLLEDPLGPVSEAVRQLEVRLRPWEIRTLLVRSGR